MTSLFCCVAPIFWGVDMKKQNIKIIAGLAIVGFLGLVAFGIQLYCDNRVLQARLVEIAKRTAVLEQEKRDLVDSIRQKSLELESKQQQLQSAQRSQQELREELVESTDELTRKQELYEQAQQESERLRADVNRLSGEIQTSRNSLQQREVAVRDLEGKKNVLSSQNALLEKENGSFRSAFDSMRVAQELLDRAPVTAQAEYIVKRAKIIKKIPADYVADTQVPAGNDPAVRKKTELNNRGIDLARKGDFLQAQKVFEQALRLDPNYRCAQLNLGLVYERVKIKDEALAYWMKLFGVR
jgi:tetratricopeptide (TPR) repeat protein